MDPNANLAEQIELALAITRRDIGCMTEADADNADNLAELVLVLNDWIKQGGCLPERWTK